MDAKEDNECDYGKDIKLRFIHWLSLISTILRDSSGSDGTKMTHYEDIDKAISIEIISFQSIRFKAFIIRRGMFIALFDFARDREKHAKHSGAYCILQNAAICNAHEDEDEKREKGINRKKHKNKEKNCPSTHFDW